MAFDSFSNSLLNYLSILISSVVLVGVSSLFCIRFTSVL